MSRLNFLTDVTALGSLCSPAAITRLEGAAESLNSRDRRNFLRGYRLAVGTSLYGLLGFVVDYAELLGFANDDRLFNWMHYHRRGHVRSLLSAVSDPTSDLGHLCYVFDDLTIALRTAEGGLADTIAAIEKCRAVAVLFDRVMAGTEIVSLDTGEGPADRESLLRICVAERVLDYVEYERIVLLARELVWGSREKFHPPWSQFVLNAETHLDSVPLFPSNSGVPREWLKGLRFGFDLVIQLNGISLPSPSTSEFTPSIGPNWFNDLRHIVNPLYPRGKWPSEKYGLTEFVKPRIREGLDRLEVNMDTVSSKHRLAAILGSDTVRLMTSAGGTNAIELEVILAGAVANHGDVPVQLLLLTHSVASDDREWVSVAIRLPMYGTFSNASKWFLFYKMYHKGCVFDSDVARNAKAVEGLLSRFKDNLEVKEINDIDADDLLPFCELPAFRAMREMSHRSVEVNADLRAGNSELQAAYWLAGRGYSDVKVSFKRASLGEFEYDAIGVRDGRCLVLEMKSANLRDDELQREIARFADKVEHLHDRLPALTDALGCESSVDSVSGLFIFLGDLKHFEPTDQSVSLWGYDEFVNALKEIGLPDRIVSLLDRSHILRLDGFPDDPFSVGL